MQGFGSSRLYPLNEGHCHATSAFQLQTHSTCQTRPCLYAPIRTMPGRPSLACQYTALVQEVLCLIYIQIRGPILGSQRSLRSRVKNSPKVGRSDSMSELDLLANESPTHRNHERIFGLESWRAHVCHIIHHRAVLGNRKTTRNPPPGTNNIPVLNIYVHRGMTLTQRGRGAISNKSYVKLIS